MGDWKSISLLSTLLLRKLLENRLYWDVGINWEMGKQEAENRGSTLDNVGHVWNNICSEA